MLIEPALDPHVERIERDGYTILEDAIEPELLDALTDDLERLERVFEVVPADNSFEGTKTVRVYNLLALGKVYESIPVHPHVLPLVERVLDPGCLVSSLSSIVIGPGEAAQPIHADDQLIPIPKPHVPTVCNTMWALTDFTEANGATRVIPGSHLARPLPRLRLALRQHSRRDGERKRARVARQPLARRRRQHDRRTRRAGIAMNYSAGFIRQQENQQLGIPHEVAAGFSPRLRELVGYGIYNGLIGHIDKHDPAEMLGDAPAADRMVWDALG